MRVRRATPEDARSIALVHVRSWKGAFPGLVPQGYLDALSPDDRVDTWMDTLASTHWPRLGTFALVDSPAGDGARGGPEKGADATDDRIVGFACMSPSRDDDADPTIVGEIQTLYLDPPAWGQGGGGLLLAAVVHELRRALYRRATLWVLHGNARARRFYEQRGWHPDGATKLHDWGSFAATDVRYAVALDRRPAGPGRNWR